MNNEEIKREKEIKDLTHNKEVQNKSLIEEIYKKSELNAKSSFDFDKLVRENNFLVNATYRENVEEVIFSYDTKELKNISNLKNEDKTDILQFLINFSKLESTAKDYKFDFNVSHIYYDENMCVRMKKRDIYSPNENKVDFLKIYKSIACGIISKKYTIDEILKSGIGMLKNDKNFEDIINAETTDDVVASLKNNKKSIIEKEKNTKVSVNKKSYKVKQVLAFVSPILFIITLALFIYQVKIVKPKDDMVIKGNQAYNNVMPDYAGCIEAMKDLKISDMDKNTKYILAVSYAKAESLEKKEIDSIVSKLSLDSDKRELEYWIELGRLNTKSAIEKAKSLSNDQLLMYAYMKELDRTESNESINGNEKESKIKDLRDKIKELGDKYTSEDEEEENSLENNNIEGNTQTEKLEDTENK